MKKRASQKNMIRKTALYTEVSFYEPSRFPGLQLKSPFPSHIKCNGYECGITEYSDRIVQDSHLIPSSENSVNFIYFSALGTFILLSKVIITYALTKVKNFL